MRRFLYIGGPFLSIAILLGLFVYCRPDMFHMDTYARRKQVAAHVRDLVARIKTEDNDEAMVRELVDLANGDYPFGATVATVGLGEIGKDVLPFIDKVGDLLFSNDGVVSREAAYSLAKLGPIAVSQLDKLSMAISDPTFAADYAVFEAIGNMGEEACDLLPLLRKKQLYGVSEISDYPLKEAIKKIELTGCSK